MEIKILRRGIIVFLALALAGGTRVQSAAPDNCPPTTFGLPAILPVGFSPTSAATGDFDGDGKFDLVVGSLGVIGIFLGNGNGTFRAGDSYFGVQFPFSLATGDFNSDGKVDVTVVDDAANLKIFFGNGDGTFRSAVTYDTGGVPYAVTVSDLNGDNKPDLIVANPGLYDAISETYSGGKTSALLGNGDGTFQTPLIHHTGDGSHSVAVADFNHDGKRDLVVANRSSSVVVLLGNGDGTF